MHLVGSPFDGGTRDWEAADGSRPESTGDLYQRLMDKVQAAISWQRNPDGYFCLDAGRARRNAEKHVEMIYTASLEGSASAVVQRS